MVELTGDSSLLRKVGAEAGFWKAIQQNDADTVRGLYEEDFTVRHEEIHIHGVTVTSMQCAALYGSIQVLEQLLLSGCAPDMVTVTSCSSTPLYLACCHPEVEASCSMARLLLQHGADVNRGDPRGDTPLVSATEKGRVELVALLCAHGAGLNMPTSQGGTALGTAVQNSDEKLVQMLCEYGGDVNQVDGRSGCTPLVKAVRARNVTLVQMLCSYGGDVSIDVGGVSPVSVALECGALNVLDILDSFRGNSSLITAAAKGQLGMISSLCAQGADVNISDEFGRTPLFISARNGHPWSIMQTLLLYGADVNRTDNFGRTALAAAAEVGHTDGIRILGSYGADDSLEDVFGCTPLLLAAREAHESAVRALLLQGADINDSVTNGCSPLTYAIENYPNPESVIHTLSRCGADPNKRDRNGHTPLIKALGLHDVESVQRVVSALIACGADVRGSDSLGNTPLFIAAKQRRTEVIRNLTSEKAAFVQAFDVAVAKRDVETIKTLAANCVHIDQSNSAVVGSLTTAARQGQYEVVKLLLDHVEDANKALLSGAQQGQLDAMKLLLLRGADINYGELESGSTPLIIAAQRGQDEALRLLLAHGADVNKGDDMRCSALVAAVRKGHASLIPTLCAHGADVNQRFTDELAFRGRRERPHSVCTALMVACKENGEDAVQQLLSNQCKVNEKNIHGNTALHLACHSFRYHSSGWCSRRRVKRRCQKPETVRLLLEHPECDYNATNNDGETALHWTIKSFGSTGHLKTGDLDLIQSLIRAGCSTRGAPCPGESTLSTLLKTVKKSAVRRNLECRSKLLKLFCDCVELLLSAGHIGKADLALMNCDALREELESRGIQEWVEAVCGVPESLQRLCKFAIRRLTSKPLATHLPDTGLPSFLQKYVLLEIRD